LSTEQIFMSTKKSKRIKLS